MCTSSMAASSANRNVAGLLVSGLLSSRTIITKWSKKKAVEWRQKNQRGIFWSCLLKTLVESQREKVENWLQEVPIRSFTAFVPLNLLLHPRQATVFVGDDSCRRHSLFNLYISIQSPFGRIGENFCRSKGINMSTTVVRPSRQWLWVIVRFCERA